MPFHLIISAGNLHLNISKIKFSMPSNYQYLLSWMVAYSKWNNGCKYRLALISNILISVGLDVRSVAIGICGINAKDFEAI